MGNNVQKIALTFVLIALVLLNFSFYDMTSAGNMNSFIALKLLLTLGAFILLVKAIGRMLRETSGKATWRLSLNTVLLFLLFLELVFTFIARSHHAEVSYASIIWQNRYYHLNDNGFRDLPIDQKNTAKPALVFLGDSFTAGLGTKYTNQRFSNLVHNEFSTTHEFYNIGLKATSPLVQREQLNYVPNEHKTLIYQAFANDLDDFCDRQLATHSFDIYQNFSPYDKYYAKALFLINYVYFSFPNDDLIEHYYDFYNECSNKPEVYAKYEETLLNMFIKAHDQLGYERVILVFIPTLAQLSFGSDYKEHLQNSIKELSFVQFADVEPKIEQLPIRKRIVNWQDTHASRKVQRIIANEVIQLIEEAQ